MVSEQIRQCSNYMYRLSDGVHHSKFKALQMMRWIVLSFPRGWPLYSINFPMRKPSDPKAKSLREQSGRYSLPHCAGTLPNGRAVFASCSVMPHWASPWSCKPVVA